MNTRSAALAALTAGLLVGCSAALGSAALADTSGEGGILSGNQVFAPINAPINLSGNAIAVLGKASASSKGKTVIGPPEPSTSGKGGILSGNQILAPVNAPITVCGNAVSILGSAAAGCGYEVVIKAPTKSKKKKPHHHHGHGPSTSGKGGILSGNQVFAPVNAPITACGNAVAVLGQAEAGCQVLVKTGGGDHDGGGSKDGHHGGGGHHGGPGNGHHGGGSGGNHHGGGSGGGHHGGGSGNGHHGGKSEGGHHGGGSGGKHHSAGSGTGGKHNGGNAHGSGGQETGGAAAAPAPQSPGHAHKKGDLPLTGVPTGLLACLGASALVAGAILMAVGRRRRSGAAEGGASVS